MKIALCCIVLVCVGSAVQGEERRPSLISPAAAARLEREMGHQPRTEAEKRQAVLERARRQHLFTMGSTPESKTGEGAKPTRFSVALKNVREASEELFGLVFRFGVANRAFVMLGVLAVIGLVRVVSSQLAAIRKRREVRGLLGTPNGS